MEVELVPQSVEDLKKLIQEHSKNEGSLMWTCEDNNMQGIPLGEKCRKVNLSKLLQSQAESNTVKMFPLRKEVKMMACKIVPDELKEKREEMQRMIGPDLTITIENFENWSKTQKAHVLAAHPETLDQLTRSIVAARDMGLKIRCAGARHS